MKKILSIIITVIMIGALVSCSNSNSVNTSEKEQNIDERITETSKEAPTKAPAEEIGERVSSYKPIDSFINGFVWVEYEKDLKGLMNENGKIIYSVNREAKTNPVSENGYTFLNVKNDKLYTNTIIDKEGKETFILQDTENDSYKIWAQGDDAFLVSHQQSGFEDIKYSVYVINSKGEMIGTKKDIEKQPESVINIGNKMFFVSFDKEKEYRVFNCNNDTFYLLNGSEKYYPIYNGTGYFFSHIYQDKEPYHQYAFGSITYSDIDSEEAWSNWMSNHSADQESYRAHDPSADYIQEGYRIDGYEYKKDHVCFFDYDDKRTELPELPEKATLEENGVFSGGYLPIYLKGADKKYYVTVVDTSGKQMYEPVKISEAMFLPKDSIFSSNGNVFVYEAEQYRLIDVTGKSTTLSINPSGKVQGYDGDYVYHIKGIWSLKDNKELKAYLPANGSTASKTSENSSEKPSAKQKNYVVKNNFSIIGKWKNVGDYTFGQAQKGSIISFDGTNCNFFSPKDTYAFYKNGDNYKLDCTSPLADTVSFTVKIVDENNIDVFNGSDIIELKRVS